MKIAIHSILLESFSELDDFITTFDLAGEVVLSNPVLDNSGKILLREGKVLLPGIMKRLQAMAGDYAERFEVPVNEALIARLRKTLAREMSNPPPGPDQEFIAELIRSVPGSIAGILSGALISPELNLLLFKLRNEKPRLFRHLTALGLLALGVLGSRSGRYLRRDVLLAGICCDLALLETNYWAAPPARREERRKIAEICSEATRILRLPPEVYDAITGFPVNLDFAERNAGELKPGIILPLNEAPFSRGIFSGAAQVGSAAEPAAGPDEPTPENANPNETRPASPPAEGTAQTGPADLTDPVPAVQAAKPDPAPADAAQPEQTAAATDGSQSASDRPDPERARIMREVLRAAHYVRDIARATADPANFTEETVYFLTYLSIHGHFSAELVDGVVDCFKRFHDKALRIRKIAEIEKECPHGGSARAYPRPYTASQMICTRRILDCPKIVGNWELHVIKETEAFGRFGEALPAARYPKCGLGERLAALTGMRSFGLDDESVDARVSASQFQHAPLDRPAQTPAQAQ